MDCYVPPQVEHVQYVEAQENLKEDVRSVYGKVAEANSRGCSCGTARSCCGVPSSVDAGYAMELGYSAEELASVPDGANMGLGCGTPQGLATLKAGERVLDLGAGGGFDAFLAARRVGPQGRVFGVDMTPAMVEKARMNAHKAGVHNVEFLLGEIEHLPLADRSVDVIISNCVVNLSVDKGQVFREAYRVLESGGRLAISDMVAYRTMPPEIASSAALHCACIAGAPTIDELKTWLKEAGFVGIRVETVDESKMFIKDWAPEVHAENYVVSAKITAEKPV